MATIAAPSDVKRLWLGSGQLPPESVVEAWLEKAETLIASQVPDLDDRLANDANGDLAQKIIFVAASMVMRVFRNPDGVRQRSNTAGTFSEQVTFGTETIRQPLVIEPEELAMIIGRSSPAARAFGVDMIESPPPVSPLQGALINGMTGTGPGGL